MSLKDKDEKLKDEAVLDEESVAEDISEEAEKAEGADEAQDATPEEEAVAEETSEDAKENKKAKKDKKDEKIEELEDRVKRQMAEFENFRRRSETEKAAMYGMGAKAVIEKILPVIDNFERGLQAIPEDDLESPVAQGMQMIYKQLLTELENLGVQPIETVGKEFDANLHNAVMQVESEEYESGVIAQELQKGYMYRDSVVRHSMVAVVQ